MAQLMKTAETPPELRRQRGKMLPVKREVELENSSDEELCPLNKRSKLSYSLQEQLGLGAGGFLVSPLQDGSLDEPSPLGLRLRKSPSLLDLIQMRLSQSSTSKAGSHRKKEQKGSTGLTEKLKASNFPASVLRIGSWEYKSRYEGDLVAKCYFAKHKLVWEVLDGGLKNKIEIQWSDIMGLKANYPDDAPGTLDVVLERRPLFFRETNPQPRKHTLWQATSDFTEGQASVHRRHYLQCPQGLLRKHFEKLMQCDPRLNFLSQQAEIKSDSPYFESRLSVFEDPHVNDREFDLNDDGNPNFLDLQSTTSPSGAHCSKSKSEQDPVGRPLECIHQEKPSPYSGATEDIKSREVEQRKGLSDLNQLRVPGMHPSVSMSDLVSHLEQRVSRRRRSPFAVFRRHSEAHTLPVAIATVCMCSFSLQPFLPEWASSSCAHERLRKLAPAKSSRPRRKVRQRHAKRAWCDSLIYSNLVYALAAIISYSCDQNFCAVLQMGAAIASTMFHRSKETKYLLLDALISGTLGVIFIFAGQHTLSNEWYGILAIKTLLASLCVFTWLYCGMPGGERYDKWHKRWHYVSGATTISTTLFLTMYLPEFDLLMHELIQDVVVVRSMFI